VRSLTVGVWAAALLAGTPQAWGLGAGKGLDRYAVERWRVSDGLPGDSVQALAQAGDGQLWIATLGGLARYDGIRFTRVPGRGDGKGEGIDVRRLLAAWDGSVWAGSPYFVPLRFVGDRPAAIDARIWDKRTGVLAWAEDEAGALWMADGRGLVRFADGRLTTLAVGGLVGRPTEVHLHASGTLWVGTDEGLFSLVEDRLVRFPEVTGPVSAIHEDRRGVLWVAAGERLWSIDGGRARSLGASDGLPRGPISSLAD
jgi:ligand-binding sensor domain-containing protein